MICQDIWDQASAALYGRLRCEPLHTWMPDELERNGFLMLSVTVEHALAVAALPTHHDDPFDRLLIAQARVERLTVVTSDTVFDQYDVGVLDARV
jgi:PIN domain nuclease of toxin-antitoxin system